MIQLPCDEANGFRWKSGEHGKCEGRFVSGRPASAPAARAGDTDAGRCSGCDGVETLQLCAEAGRLCPRHGSPVLCADPVQVTHIWSDKPGVAAELLDRLPLLAWKRSMASLGPVGVMSRALELEWLGAGSRPHKAGVAGGHTTVQTHGQRAAAGGGAAQGAGPGLQQVGHRAFLQAAVSQL
jgi:hypothetical protein